MMSKFDSISERIEWIFELYHVNDVWKQYLSCTHPDDRVADIQQFITKWPEVNKLISDTYAFTDNADEVTDAINDIAEPYFQEHYCGRFFTGPQRIYNLVQRFNYVTEYVIDCKRYSADRIVEKVMFWENEFDQKLSRKYWFESPTRLCVITEDEKK